MHPSPDIIVTDVDRERLERLIEQHARNTESLDAELQRARVVPQRAVPADVVTMNSKVVYEDCLTGARREVTLVYPKDANMAEGALSVLAPVGSALLGMSVGQTIEWTLPNGRQARIRVVELIYQPEAAGEFAR